MMTTLIRRLIVPLALTAGLVGLATATPAPASAQPSAASARPAGVVNIQTATAAELQLLPGIGPSKAQAIVAHRERRPFRRPEDLMRVRGIGRTTFRRVRTMITVNGPTTLTASRPSRSSAAGSGGDGEAPRRAARSSR